MTVSFNIVQDGNIRNIPYDKHSCLGVDRRGYCPAINSGTVVLKCMINGISPFMLTERTESTLCFNSFTMHGAILDQYPPQVRHSIQTISGVEGMTLQPNYIYRTTYLTAISRQVEEGSGIRAIEVLEGVIGWNDVELEYDFFASNYAKYKEEQTWIITASLFEDDFLRPSEFIIDSYMQENCVIKSMWGYDTLDVSNSMTEEDKENDGISEYEADGYFTPNTIKYPTQLASPICSGLGVHWGLIKKTRLFEGEDFFIEIRKKNESISVPMEDSEEQIGFANWTKGPYSVLDATAEFAEVCDVETGLSVYPNQVVIGQSVILDEYTGREIGYKIVDRSTYNFKNQPYYIIEIGDEILTPNDRYFIIIAYKAPIKCVRISNGISWNVGSPFQGNLVVLNDKSSSPASSITITGKSLIEARWFRMSVRNWLGRWIVEFTSSNGTYTPWIIERTDANNQRQILNVPPGRISFFGGNMLAGFIFGPIQYNPSEFTFRHPPKTMTISESVSSSFNFCGEESLESMYAGSASADFSFPIDSGPQHILLSETDVKIDNVYGNIYFPGKSKAEQKMYVQDAQIFGETKDGKLVTSRGSFFQGPPLREKLDQSFLDAGAAIRKFSAIIDRSELLLGLRESSIVVLKRNSGRDYLNRSQMFFVQIELIAGDHAFAHVLTSPEGGVAIRDENGLSMVSKWRIRGCKPPIMTIMRLISEANEDPRWVANPIDASDHVMSFTESWNATDFSQISHTGNIRFLLNEGIPFEDDITERLLSLRDKSFTIEIWGGYFSKINNYLEGMNICNYSQIPGLYKLFTGRCEGGTVTRSYGHRAMECKIDDFTEVLKNSVFFNAPFYDGVRDVNAVNNILEMAGFRSDIIPTTLFFNDGTVATVNNYGPRHLIKNLTETFSNDRINIISPDGRVSFVMPYALPSSYARLLNPFFKAKDGDKFYDTLTKIIERGAKIFYFDQFGVARMENFFDQFQNVVLNGINDEIPNWFYTTNPDVWMGQLVFNKMMVQHDVSSTFNHLKLLWNTPDHDVNWFDDINWNSIYNPDSEGFIGYRKTFYQADGIIGSEQGALNMFEFYRRTIFRPPLVVDFESYGQPLRALDLIFLNGVPLRIMKVDSSMDPRRNIWWQTVNCEWTQWISPVPSGNLMTKKYSD